MAVGVSSTMSSAGAFIYNGSSFVSTTTSSNAQVFFGVSCSTASFCEAVGISTSFGGLAAAYNGSSWTTDTLPSVVLSLNSVSCLANSTCDSLGNTFWDSSILTNSQVPIIASVSPSSGPTAGGTPVVITGDNLAYSSLANSVSVYFGSTKATSFTVVSNTQIDAVAPPAASPGIVTVSVVTPAGSSVPAQQYDANFLYVNPGVTYSESPVRIVDTRPGAVDPPTYAGKTLTPGQTLTVTVTNANSDNVPTTASAVIINLTAVHPTAAGYLTIYPTGLARPNTSNVNFAAGENAVANFVEVPIGLNGQVNIYNAFGDTNVLVDVEG